MEPQDNPSPALASPLEAPRRFGPSGRALAQRRAVLTAVKAALFACLLLLAWGFAPPSLLFNLAKWAVVAAACWGLWQAGSDWVLGPLAARELKLHGHALELGRGDFRRLVVFDSLRHIHAVQAKGGGRFISLRLDTDDDSVLLRDLQGLPEAFADLAAKKPEKCLIEIEERAVDWGEPLPWLAVAGGGALLLALLLAWLMEPETLRSAAGRLMVAESLALGAWRPLGRSRRLPAVAGEITGLLLLLAVGWLMA